MKYLHIQTAKSVCRIFHYTKWILPTFWFGIIFGCISWFWSYLPIPASGLLAIRPFFTLKEMLNIYIPKRSRNEVQYNEVFRSLREVQPCFIAWPNNSKAQRLKKQIIMFLIYSRLYLYINEYTCDIAKLSANTIITRKKRNCQEDCGYMYIMIQWAWMLGAGSVLLVFHQVSRILQLLSVLLREEDRTPLPWLQISDT